MSTAPVIIFGYNRPNHFRKTLFNLSLNVGAKNTDVFIFVDGPKKNEDIDLVNEVKKIAYDYSEKKHFKQMLVFCHDRNIGLANSIIYGVTRVLKNYSCVIVLEDDIVTTKYFLHYMNTCLKKFKNNKYIWSISAYTPQLKSLNDMKGDLYLTFRGCSWGWATWCDRWEKIDWECSSYGTLMYHLVYRWKLSRGGLDLPSMLRKQMNKEIDSWAVRWSYNQALNNSYTIYPKIGMVDNIGFDGSGTHCGVTNAYKGVFDDKLVSRISSYKLKKSNKIILEFNNNQLSIWRYGLHFCKRIVVCILKFSNKICYYFL